MYSNVLRFSGINQRSKNHLKMAPSGHYTIFSGSSLGVNNCCKSPNDTMFRPFRRFFYFSRLEISFALLLGYYGLPFKPSYQIRYIFLILNVVSTETMENEERKRLHIETGNTPNKPQRKRQPTSGSSRKSLFCSPLSEKVGLMAIWSCNFSH